MPVVGPASATGSDFSIPQLGRDSSDRSDVRSKGRSAPTGSRRDNHSLVDSPEVNFSFVWIVLGVLTGTIIGLVVTGSTLGVALGALCGLCTAMGINLLRARERGDLGGRSGYRPQV